MKHVKLQDVPDAESEKKMNLSPSIATFDFELLKPKKNKIHPTSEESAPPPKKTKQTIMQIKNNPLAVDKGTYAKSQKETTSLHRTLLKHKTSNSSMTQSVSMTEKKLVTTYHGCIWSSSDWSCAYDSVFMIFTYMHQQPPSSWAKLFQIHSPLACLLSHQIEPLNSDSSISLFNHSHDMFHDALFSKSQSKFPRHGPVGSDLVDIFHELDANSIYTSPLVF